MSKLILKAACMVLVCASTALAVNSTWINGDGYWKDPNNWAVDGGAGRAVPTISDDVYFWSRDAWTDPLGIDASDIQVYIDKGTNAACQDIMGLGTSFGWKGTLWILNGGSLTVARYVWPYCYGDTAMVIDGGTFTPQNEFRIGGPSNATVTMRGGFINSTTIYLGYFGSSPGKFYVDNGTVSCTNWMPTPVSAGSVLDIRGGLVRFRWFESGAGSTAYYQGLVGTWIKSFGGAADVNVSVVEADGSKWTYLTAQPKTTTPYLKTTPNTMSINEQGATSSSYSLVLNTAPSADVTVTIAPIYDPNRINLGAGAGQSITKTFTTSNWNVAQTVTATAVDDAISQGTEYLPIRHTASSTDTNYNGELAYADVITTVLDNDSPSLNIIETGGNTTVYEDVIGQPASDSFTVALGQNPQTSVTVTVDPNGNGLGNHLRLNGGLPNGKVTLTFTTSNWNTPQTINVAAVDMLSPTNFNAVVGLIASGGVFTGVTNNVNVKIMGSGCGAWGYQSMDFNENCKVDIGDFAAFAQQWLLCTDPKVAGCVNLNP